MANSIEKIFPNTVLLMCWFHVKKNVKKKVKECKVPKKYVER